MQTTKNSSQLNGYTIGKTIGRGTFGKVKTAIHKLTGEPVAIKFLQKQRIKDTSDVQRVSRQLHFLKIVRHPAIAQMYEILETPRMIFIVMEYAAGGEYFDYVMEQKIKDEAEAFHYFSQVLFALIYLHKLKISHRDVKPQNMLLDSQKRIKLVDFGLSNMYKAGEKLSTACGSPCYASPEMIKGEDYDPELTDVWSLGIVLFTSVLARLPFEDQSTNALYAKIKSGLYVIDRKISPELKDLLSRTVNTDPEKRIRLKQILQHSWYKKHSAHNKEILGIQIGYENIPIDKSIVKQMESLGYEGRKAVKYLQNNVKNECTTTYYLLLKKNFKLGRASLMDICSENFKKQVISPFFSLKPRRYKSFDEGRFPENQKSLNQPLINKRKCSSQIKTYYETSSINGNERKPEKSFSLKRQTIRSIDQTTHEQSKIIENTKMDKFLKMKARLQVKQKLFRKSSIKNRSLSISTQKVANRSLKKLDQKKQASSITKIQLNISNDLSSLKNFNFKISSNQDKLKTRFKTDFISQIYCPTKKKSNQKNTEASKQKSHKNHLNLDLDVGSLFWRKKSTTLKKTNVFTGGNYQNRAIRGHTCGNG